MEQISFSLRLPEKKRDEPLDRLLNVLNESRKEVNLKPLTYPRLQSMLKTIGKSKKGWDRNIFIGDVLDARNPSSYFWSKFNTKKLETIVPNIT